MGTDLCMFNVSNSSFVNTSSAQGGAINIECTNVKSVSFQDSIFTGNRATGTHGGGGRGGGAVCIDSPGSESNRATYSVGGAVDVNSIFGTKAYQSRFSNNTAGANGTVTPLALIINSQDACRVTLARSTFLNNVADGDGGGAISISSNTQTIVILQTVTMESNRAKYHGGALFLQYSTLTLMIDKSRFFNNTANEAGAIDISPSLFSRQECHVTIERSTFSNNYAWGGAGAISLCANNQSVLLLETVTMESNRVQYSGGAVVIYSIFALKVRKSWFINNTALTSEGGVFSVYNANVLELQECHFHSNRAKGDSYGGALYVRSYPLSSTSILITKTTFTNCHSRMGGGALFLDTLGNVSLRVKRSRFVENYSLKNEGGAIAIYLDPDTPNDPGCIKTSFAQASQIHDTKEFPSWLYKSHLTFEDTIFERNAAVSGGALHLLNGKVIFRNCSFIDNFASTLGGNIHTETGSASLIIRASSFHQNIKKLRVQETQYTTGSFIYAESSGALKVANTTFEAIPYSNTLPLMLVRNGRQIDLKSNHSTTFNCPVGSQMEIVNFFTKWDSILDLYKLSLIKLFYNIVIEKIPKTISDLVTWRHGPSNLRGHLKAVVPRFSTSFLKNSIRYRGAVLWNFVSSYFNNATNHKQFCKKARMDPIFKKLNFGSLSIQTTPKHMCDFQF